MCRSTSIRQAQSEARSAFAPAFTTPVPATAEAILDGTSCAPTGFRLAILDIATETHVVAARQKECAVSRAESPKLGVFSRSRPNLWDTVAVWVCETPERKAFSYNKRTMDWAMRPF
jgi:hypothetical protein